MKNLFLNFEDIKLDIPFPDSTNLMIIVIFLLGVLLTFKRSCTKSNNFLNIRLSLQLKGFAIFFVILGHLWVHVSRYKPMVIFSGDSVSMFLMLSGFGLTISSGSVKLNLKEFLLNRINRVLIPYWFVTIIILMLDFYIIEKILPGKSILKTLLAWNFADETRNLDYVRWFVSFILLWYVIFFISHNYINKSKRGLFFFSFGFILLLVDYYYLDYGWYQNFSFPLGCILAINYPNLIKLISAHRSKFCILSGLGIVCVLLYEVGLSSEQIQRALLQLLPNILLVFLNEVSSMVFNISLILIFGYIGLKNLESKLLIILGRYSYELFLLHGIFLIKYNPIFSHSSEFNILIGFFILMTFLFGLSILISKTFQIKKALKVSG